MRRAALSIVWTTACGVDAGTDTPTTTTTPALTDTPRSPPTFAPSAVWDSFANDWEPTLPAASIESAQRVPTVSPWPDRAAS